MLELRLDPGTTAADVKARAEAKITEIDGKVRDLQQIRHALVHLAGRCHGRKGPVGECPLLDGLERIGSEG